MVKSGQHGERTGETHRKSGPGQGSVQQECSAVSVEECLSHIYSMATNALSHSAPLTTTNNNTDL